MEPVFSAERINELKATYEAKIAAHNPRAYTGRAMYMARLHHFIELAGGKVTLHWLSGKEAKTHKFLLFVAIGNGNIRELVFDMVMTEAFSFGQATMGDSNCGAVTRDRFESQWQVEEHIKGRILALTGQEVTIQ